MKIMNPMRSLALTIACGAVALVSSQANLADTLPANAAAIRANAGVTFAFAPTTDPSRFTATADGVVQVSLMGNCSEHAQLVVQFPTGPGQPITLSGSVTLTSSDGANSLKFNVTGIAAPDPANPGFLNNNYQATFTGGTGAFAFATGAAQISETTKFTSPATGTGTWTMKGYVVTPPSAN